MASEEPQGDFAVQVEASFRETQCRARHVRETFPAEAIDLRRVSVADGKLQILFQRFEVESRSQAKTREQSLAQVVFTVQLLALRSGQRSFIQRRPTGPSPESRRKPQAPHPAAAYSRPRQ